MDISGSSTFHAPREQVWDALLNPDMIRRAVPGCESLEQTGDNTYALRLNVNAANIRGVYNCTLRALDAQKPASYRFVIDGTGARGILHGEGVMRLEAKDAGATDVQYQGQLQLGGGIASLGAQVARGAANMLFRQYFTRLAHLLPAAPVPAAAPSVATAMPASASAPPAEALATPAPVAPMAPVAPPIPPSPAPTVASQPSVEPAVVAPPAPFAQSAAPEQAPVAPVANVAPPGGMAEGAPESGRPSSRVVGVVVAIVAVVVVALIIWLAAGAFR